MECSNTPRSIVEGDSQVTAESLRSLRKQEEKDMSNLSPNIPYIQLSHHPEISHGLLKDAWISQYHSASALPLPDIDREAISLLCHKNQKCIIMP